MGRWAVRYGDSLYRAVANLAEIEALMCASQISFVTDVSSFPEVEASGDPDDNAYFEGKDIWEEDYDLRLHMKSLWS